MQTIDCNKSTLLVNGTANTAYALGSCWAVTMQGSSNVVVTDNIVDNVIVYGKRPDRLLQERRAVVWDRGRESGHDQPHRPGTRLTCDTVLHRLAVQSRTRAGRLRLGKQRDQRADRDCGDVRAPQVEIGNTINYGSFGTTADIDCADGKSLNVGGSNNTLTVKRAPAPA